MAGSSVSKNRWQVGASKFRFLRGIGQNPLRLIAIGAAVVGVGLRVRMYLENRSLWLDPSMLALNVVNKDASELLGRLDMNQAAPPGFLLAAKAVGSLFGYSEYSLYVLPCLFGIAAFLLFIRLSIAVLGPLSAPLAFVPMATCSTAIFYCGEFRPQSADLFLTVLVLTVAYAVLTNEWKMPSIAAFVTVGIVAVWFSYAVVFVVAGTGFSLVLVALISGKPPSCRRITAAVAIVMLHFLLLYLLHIRPSIGSDLYAANSAAFAPVVPTAKSQLWWWILAVTGYFHYPLGFRGFIFVPLVGLLTGVVVSLSSRKSAPIAAVVGLPMVALFVASGLGMYPITTGNHEVRARFVLFTVPITLLFVARGTSWLCGLAGKKTIFSWLIVAFLVLPSLVGGFAGPRFRGQEMRPLTRHLLDNFQPGDTVYVFSGAVPAFRYYTRNESIEAVYGRRPRPGSLDLADDLRRAGDSGRLWVVVSHAYNGERRIIRKALSGMGRLEGVHRFHGAVLFDCQLGDRASRRRGERARVGVLGTSAESMAEEAESKAETADQQIGPVHRDGPEGEEDSAPAQEKSQKPSVQEPRKNQSGDADAPQLRPQPGSR